MQRYTLIAIVLHWLVAVVAIVAASLPWLWPHLADESVRPVINLHKSLGITILGLALMRILWRISHAPPPLPDSYARHEQLLAKWVHRLLYGLILVLPISGWVMDSAYRDAALFPMPFFGLFEWPRLGPILTMDPSVRESIHSNFGALHVYMSWALYVLVALHIVGALKHQVIDGNPALRRMLPGA